MLGAVAMGNIYSLASTSEAPPQNTAKNTSSTTTYGAPLLLLDAGVLLGSAGGAKVHRSGLFMAQFVGGPVQAPAMSTPGNPTKLGTNSAGVNETCVAGPFNVAQGTQIFIGPMIGLDFGL
jgi:hypothetical protein